MPDREPTPEMERHPYHRRFLRHKVRLRVRVNGERSFQTWTHNVSEGGSCFEIPEALSPGRVVSVTIYLAEAPVEAQARVVWSDRGRKGQRHGAEFVSFEGDGRERLRGFLATLGQA